MKPSHNLSFSRRTLLKGAASTLAVSAAFGVASPTWADGKDPFIESLIAKMSVVEKAGQLSLYGDPTRPDPDARDINPKAVAQSKEEVKAQIRKGEITGLFNGIGAVGARDLQKVAIEEGPHKIPLIFGADIIHGCRTIFPIPLAESCAFDPDLAARTTRVAAIEATASGIHWTFAPMVDVARDQRWGRVAEGAGEDPYLGSVLAAARVRGFQGSDLKNDDSMLATPKHFAAYGAVQGGMDYNTADIPETTLRQTHLPSFKAAFDAGAFTTMSAFDDIAGVPATGNHHLLSDILRDEWKFRGFVVSDYTSEEEMIAHGYAADGRDATKKALMAGTDMSMQSGLYFQYIPDLVKSGDLPMAVLDEAVRRVLRVKKAIGLFENPYRSMNPKREKSDIRRPEFVALAREAGHKAPVLLKNDGDLLPLKKSGQKIALIGPHVSNREDLVGAWAVFPDWRKAVTFEEGFRAAMSDPKALKVAKGSDIEAAIPGGIEDAVAAAKDSDIVVLVIGESQGMSGEAQSRTDIGIPAPQLKLAEAVMATGKPVVVLLRHGRALALDPLVRKAPAIMATWFLGSETGHAIADLVFGDVNPSGRLTVSFPQASGQEPFYYNHRRTGRPQVTEDKNFKTRYREVTNDALYPFGYGLSYSKIEYGNTSVSTHDLGWNDSVTVSATVKNAGGRAVREIVQLYINDKVASITQPVRTLKGFKAVMLAPGESQTISFTLKRDDLAIVTADNRWTTEPGQFDVWVAPSSVAGVASSFTLRGA